MATYSFAGKRVLVTGGANGLGKEIVGRFLGTGATVIALDRDVKGLEALKQEFTTGDLVTLTVDLSDWAKAAEAVEKVLPIHHLVNNAAVAWGTDILTATGADIDAHMAVNFKAPFNLSQVFAKGVVSHGLNGGTIVHISSLADRLVFPGFSVYSPSKAALTMLSKFLAKELGQFKIRSNVIRPDIMQTDLFNNCAVKDPPMAAALLENDLQRSCLKKILEPRDVCQLVLFLSSDDSSMITGADIAVDGGYSVS